MTRRLTAAVLLLACALAAHARVISYAPYSDRLSIPGVAHRANRHFALMEGESNGGMFSPIYQGQLRGQVVLYDSQGEQEPRVIFPQDGSFATIDGLAVREPLGETPIILVVTANPQAWMLSIDGGLNWKKVPIPAGLMYPPTTFVDVGGFYSRSRYSNLRSGSRDYPFVAVANAPDGARLYAIAADGSAKELARSAAGQQMSLAGSDAGGQQFLVRIGSEMQIIGLDGSRTVLGTAGGAVEGWITPDRAAYVEVYRGSNDVALWYFAGGTAKFVAGTSDTSSLLPPFPGTNTTNSFFAVPSADYAGAWMVKRGVGAPTRLLFHNAQRGLNEQWSDITAPEVEAIHPSLNGDKLLIQVHRPRRAADQTLFKDPALAVWRPGEPAPRTYDELYLNESPDKGFVHLDVDAIESGAPFVFDSGRTTFGCSCGISVSPGAGGSEVVQEWGVVRGSLVQKLVLPGFGRTGGAFGSLWRSDLMLYNPNDGAVKVSLRFVPAGGGGVSAAEANAVTVTLEAKELRLIADAARELFSIDSGVGALFITPERGFSINATGRTYNQTAKGTYGYGMNAIDVFAATSARFPVTFSGAFQGSAFRANFYLTDVSGRGTDATFSVNGPYGELAIRNVSAQSAASGMMHINFINAFLGLRPEDIGALTVRPTRGEAVASLFSVDNRTNDPTFFPPDIPAGAVRTIPVIGHLEGANGSQFRSDLFLQNTSAMAKPVVLDMRSWSSSDSAILTLTLLPREARMIPDVLRTAFSRTGMARLRVGAQGGQFDSSIRVTSRTYTVDADGGTYGFLMPPLNSFQTASGGDTLEMLGAAVDNHFRTNIGLVDTTAFPTSQQQRARIDIIGTKGKIVDSFEVSVPSAGGMQLNDVFRGRGMAHDGAPVLIRVTPLSGMLGAYVAMLDQETNDPTYFAANLAAKP